MDSANEFNRAFSEPYSPSDEKLRAVFPSEIAHSERGPSTVTRDGRLPTVWNKDGLRSIFGQKRGILEHHGTIYKKSGFHGEASWDQRYVSITVTTANSTSQHEDLCSGDLKWYAKDGDSFHLRQRVDLSQVLWYSCSESDITYLLNKYKSSSDLKGSNHEWPIEGQTRYGFAFELFYGRVVVLAVNSAKEFSEWKDMFEKCIPPSAVINATSLIKSATLGTTSVDPAEYVFDCGPHAVIEHKTDILYLDLCVNNVDIITKDGSFRLDVWVQMVWENPLMEGKDVYDEAGLAEFIRREPELEFINQIEMTNKYESAPHSRAVITDEGDGLTYCQCVRRYTGIMQDLDADIKQFPFDHQDLEIKIQIYGCPIQTKNPRKLCRIVPCRIDDIRYTKHPIQHMFKHGQENYISELHGLEKNNWDFTGAKTEVYSELYDFLGIAYCVLELNFRVQRKWGFYRSQIYSVLIIICILVFTNFGFNVMEFEMRINLVVAMFLAGVAFQFTLRETIPQVKYMTMIDRYLMFTYGFIGICGINALTVNQIAIYWEDEDDHPVADEWDKLARWVIIGTWALYNIYYFADAWRIRSRHVYFRTKKMKNLVKQKEALPPQPERPSLPFTPVLDDMPLEWSKNERPRPHPLGNREFAKTSKFDSIPKPQKSRSSRPFGF